MKTIVTFIFAITLFSSAIAATNSTSNVVATSAALTKADATVQKKAADWAASLKLNDAAKEARVADAIATHLKAVRDWHNSHPYTEIPEGTNAAGKKLSTLDREMIAD